MIDRPLVMGILNVTPDSFSDGGRFYSFDDALKRAEQMIAEGAGIIDIGGESTRPGSEQIDPEVEIERTLPVVSALAKRFEVPISADTSKSKVARALLDGGAEIINDISGLRWDPKIAGLAAETGAGLVLMHSRGNFGEMHTLPAVADIFSDIGAEFTTALTLAHEAGVADEQIALDVGIGFGKTPVQNLELIAKLDDLIAEFPAFRMLVGASRKSFIGKLLDIPDPANRLSASLAAAVIAAWNGASILRVHDVRETVEALRMVDALRKVGN